MPTKKSLSYSALANALQTATRLVCALVTYPYLAKILQVDQLGRFDFASTIVDYAALTAGLGIYTYATREGAKKRDDPVALSRFASEVLTINLASTLAAYTGLGICVTCSSKLQAYAPLIGTLSLSIIFTTLGCEWLYAIHEEYVYLAARNICFQLCSLALLLTLVKDQDDLLLYALIAVLGTAGANLLNLLKLRDYCRLSLTFGFSWKKHLLPIMVLFANSLATMIFTSADIALLGWETSDYFVGLYAVAGKVYALLKQLLGAVIVVTIPRLAYLSNRQEQFQRLSRQIADVLTLLALPAACGLFALSEQVVVVTSAAAFAPAAGAMRVLSWSLIFTLFNWFYMACILVPRGKERLVLRAISAAAALNVLLNLYLIPRYQESGAALATLAGELAACVFCYLGARKEVQPLPGARNLFTSLLGCLYIYGVCQVVLQQNLSNAATVGWSLAWSLPGYLLILRLCRNRVLLEFVRGG